MANDRHLNAAHVTGTFLEIKDVLDLSRNGENFPWKPYREGVDIHRLYGDGLEGPAAALIRFRKGASLPEHFHNGFEHILVLSGSQRDARGLHPEGSFIINPPGTTHQVESQDGCLVLAIYEKPVSFLNDPATPVRPPAGTVALAVNGTLMRGLELNTNLLCVGATFLREAATRHGYRLWSIEDRHPAMMWSGADGASIAIEIWAVPPEGLASVLLREPAGLCIGKVQLSDNTEILGVLAEPWLCEGRREITKFGGWRAYTASLDRPLPGTGSVVGH